MTSLAPPSPASATAPIPGSSRAEPALWRRTAPFGIAGGALAAFVVLVVGFTDVGRGGAPRLGTGAFGSVDAVSETLTRAIPLAFVGVGAAIALRAGVFNVGGEGQMTMGAVAAVIVVRCIGGARPRSCGRSPWPPPAAARRGPWCPPCCGPAGHVGDPVDAARELRDGELAHLVAHRHPPGPLADVITAQGGRSPPCWSCRCSSTAAGSTSVSSCPVAVAGAAWSMRTPAGLRVDLVGANPAGRASGAAATSAAGPVLLISAAFAGVAGACSSSV